MNGPPRFTAALLAPMTIALAPICFADPLRLEAGKPFDLLCDTKSVVVATDAANATSGAVRLRLEAKADAPKSGTWSIVSVDDAHKGSFATSRREECAKGCPMSVPASAEFQLWYPVPKTLDKLADGEGLLIAVIKPDTLALRASTFRGKDIEALEQGQCRMVAP